jgi:hypothetical protein
MATLAKKGSKRVLCTLCDGIFFCGANILPKKKTIVLPRVIFWGENLHLGNKKKGAGEGGYK